MNPKRQPRDLHRILTAVEHAWLENRHLSLDALIIKLKGDQKTISDSRLCREINRRYP